MAKYLRLLSLAVALLVALVISSSCFAAKKVVAVMEIENSSSDYQLGDTVAQTLESEIEGALLRSGGFDVVERTQLDAVLKEMGLQSTGLFSTENALELGHLTNAQFTLLGNVLSITTEPFYNGLYSGYRGRVAFSFKLVDNATGLIKMAETLEGRYSLNEFQNSNPSREQLIRGAAGRVAKRFMEKLGESDVRTGVVLDADDSQVYVSLGTGDGIYKDQKLVVFREGKVLTNPTTGEIIAAKEEHVCTLKVESARDNHSICKKEKGGLAPRRGDKVRRAVKGK